MSIEEVLKKIREELKKEKEISEESFKNIVEKYFIKYMGYDGNCRFYYHASKDEVYDYSTENRELIILGYKNEVKEKALRIFTKYMEREKYEWGILLHTTGIWLLNNDIRLGDSDFKSQKIVFEIAITKKTDGRYFKYFSYNNLLNKKKRNTCFFRDIIDYKNKYYKGNIRSWTAYHTALKRFLDDYITNDGTYEPNSYKDIDMACFERYIKRNSSITSINTARNQFFYVKDFMIRQIDNSSFNQGSREIKKRCVNSLDGQAKNLEVMDMKKLKIILGKLLKGKNAIRNRTLILLLISFGMTRRKICLLQWEKHISQDCSGMFYEEDDKKEGKPSIPFPHILEKSMIELKKSIPQDAKYVFGNYITAYQKPLPEYSINEILSGLSTEKENDEFYKLLTTGNIRKWLFRYLLKKEYPLQYIMALLDVSISSLGNYVENKDIIASGIGKMDQLHPLEEFWNEIEYGLK